MIFVPDIGVAMDTPRGLAVPVVHNCQDLSILDIADELDRLKEAVSYDIGVYEIMPIAITAHCVRSFP
jgi:hypothetical protein